jgi:mono/diheme cytochrome c family protein
MRAAFLLVVAVSTCVGVALADDTRPPNSAVERGRGLVRGAPPLNPPVWTVGTYEHSWKQWGLKEKPADFDARFRARYGLHPAPYDNGGLPMGLHVSRGFFGKGLVNDCLLCHAGRVAGQTIIGVGNSTLDLQALFDELFAGEGQPYRLPVPVSYVRGTIDPVSPVAFLLQFRDLEMNLGKSPRLPYSKNVSSDPPAWWLLKKKKTRNWMGLIAANSTRVDMPNVLSPFNSGKYVREKESAFADIHQFILSVESPRYPFPIDSEKAARGREVFTKTCVRCHGTYGPEGSYPNKVVPLSTVGTDPLLAESITPDAIEHFNKSWLGREKDQDGKLIQARVSHAYQAPPLDGVWATAPYFHNGSVPTLYHVLNSRARPRAFTRSFGTEREDYDQDKVGLKITVVEPPGEGLSAFERRRIYDTTQPGQANRGHTFGDDLREEERLAVIEYLKSL